MTSTNTHIVNSPTELKQALNKNTAIAGLDLGDKTIGIAISDISLIIASPYKTIQRQSFDKDISALKQIIEEKEVGGIVIGLPIQMNGLE